VIPAFQRAIAWGNPFGAPANPYKDERRMPERRAARVRSNSARNLREKTYVTVRASGGIDRRARYEGSWSSERKSLLTSVFEETASGRGWHNGCYPLEKAKNLEACKEYGHDAPR
jgi:hypothetical protein